jgi:hypothetical protein
MIHPFAHKFAQFFTNPNRTIAAVGLVGFGLVAPNVLATEMQAAGSRQVLPVSPSQQSAEPSTLPTGTYLYGESQAPDQIGSAYMVFEVEDSQVTGAFYMPQSSFDCFQGRFQGDRLNLTVVDSYSQTPHDYSIAIQADSYVASANGSVGVPVQLNGYHNITEVSDNDQRMLETCKADFQ